MASISEALLALLTDHDRPVEQVLDEYFTDDYRQSTDGVWVDRGGFGERMSQLRSYLQGVEIEVVAEVTNGSVYAERHVIRATQLDGAHLGQEVFLFAELAADGRFAKVEELVHPQSPDDSE